MGGVDVESDIDIAGSLPERETVRHDFVPFAIALSDRNVFDCLAVGTLGVGPRVASA